MKSIGQIWQDTPLSQWVEDGLGVAMLFALLLAGLSLPGLS